MRIQQAKFLLRASQSDEARERLAELTKSRSVADRARFMLAETYFNDGDETRALDYFRQISQKHDSATWLKARFFIGEILFKRGEYEDAAREFSRIAFADTRDDSVYEKALYRAALCFIKTKKQREAETFRAKLKEAFPHSKYLPELQ
ncbi:MAG: tetratricopeptide repeat protein [Spirochaetes bacterium]|nr:tetratricopeptide repeat protein [Spirochaetota bacterium]